MHLYRGTGFRTPSYYEGNSALPLFRTLSAVLSFVRGSGESCTFVRIVDPVLILLRSVDH